MHHLSKLSLMIITVGFFSSNLFALNAAEKEIKPIVQEPKKDFIVGIFRPIQKSYHSKNALLEDLDFLVQDEKNVGNLTEAYRQIEQSTMLNRDEKIQWIEKKQSKLPAPFLILLANYLASSNIDEAAKWYVVGSLRMELDAEKCTEKDFTRGGNEDIMEKLLENLRQNLKGNDIDDKMANFTNSIKNQFENAVNFHKANPYKIEHPFWLANHSYQATKSTEYHFEVISKNMVFMVNPFVAYSTFKPQQVWESIEESVIYQLRKELK